MAHRRSVRGLVLDEQAEPHEAAPRSHGGRSRAGTVALLGARQVGKTTMARQVAAEWGEPTVLFDLERTEVREALSRAPKRTLRNRKGLVVVDEVSETENDLVHYKLKPRPPYRLRIPLTCRKCGA